MKVLFRIILIVTMATPNAWAAKGDMGIRIKELCRLAGATDNSLVGYGIVTGLATLGYKVMQTIGTRITELTPSRGFSSLPPPRWPGVPAASRQGAHHAGPSTTG